MLTKIRLKLSVSIIVVLIVISGCSVFPFNKEVEHRVSSLGADSILVETNKIRLETINLIENAEQAVFIQLSALDDSHILDLLIKKTQQGIDVRILLDQWQRENQATIRTLKNNNVSVQYYPAQKGQFQRARYMVVDYKVAILYGEDWTVKGAESYSIAVKLTGDTAWKITRSFDKDWLYTTTVSLNIPAKMDLHEENIVFALNANVKQQIVRQIDSSQNEIKVIVEQISDSDTVNALVQARGRGVDIKLIVSPSSAISTPNTISKLEEAGIAIRYYYHPEELSLKLNVGIFDDKSVIVSSSSWTYYSFVINHECSLTIPSPEAVGKLNNIFTQQWQTSSEEGAQ